MRLMAAILSAVILSGCASMGKNGARPRECGPTPVHLKEMEAFGFTQPKNKVTVMRIMATWCPYCKDDLTEMGKRFQSGTWSPENVHVLLLNYRNRNEGKQSFDKFVRDTFPKFGIPASAAQIVYVDRDYKELSAHIGADKKPLFGGWTGVPFALVFGKDGRLAYRGHFTNSPKVQDAHYQLITDISKEKCAAQ